jgi:hypothetical protein
MRNKILANLWALIGMIAGVRVGLLPFAWFTQILSHFFDTSNKPAGIALGILGIGIMIASAILGGRWFHYLFYRGELWGYSPDNAPESK